MAHKNLVTVSKLNTNLGGGQCGCSIQQQIIGDVRDIFGIPNSPQSLDNGQNSDERISDFQISGQSLIKGNCHNSRASDDIDMKH